MVSGLFKLLDSLQVRVLPQELVHEPYKPRKTSAVRPCYESTGVGSFRRVFITGTKTANTGGRMNHWKPGLELGVLRMGCVHRVE